MHEIVTLQFGSRANYLGTHFWNTQVSDVIHFPGLVYVHDSISRHEITTSGLLDTIHIERRRCEEKASDC